ncbi:MAG: aminotransferase class I/II-fold pyridoxal phosphate-dependent enzyme, partial [Lachnospiraceae bacterium]|nr:aminotransferase class I/II-fold pyridoxal phosphate-dependent enzyme [Lachnospiraceae bacterium]
MDYKRFDKRIWLSSPTMHGDEERYVQEAFDTNWVSTVGENLNQLEQQVADYVGCGYTVALSAGTAALHLAVKLAGVRPGDRVFCSDMTFAATVNPVSYEKAEQVFIDVERDTWNMDPVALRRAFEKYPDTKVVMVVNLYGIPAKLDEIRAICDEYGAILIEDAAESMGATYKGKQTATFGKYNVISFNGNKIITTSGGGMLITDSKEDADKARFWSTQARENFPWYQHEEVGYNYRMSNILAGIGRGQMLHLDEHIAKKKAIYMRYKEGFKGLPISMNPYTEEDMEPNFWLSCMLIDENAMDKANPDKIRELLADYNVESRPIWKPMHMQPIFAGHEFVSAKDGMDVGADIF